MTPGGTQRGQCLLKVKHLVVSGHLTLKDYTSMEILQSSGISTTTVYLLRLTTHHHRHPVIQQQIPFSSQICLT